MLSRLVTRERAAGDLRSLQNTLRRLVRCHLWRGDFAAVYVMARESLLVVHAETGDEFLHQDSASRVTLEYLGNDQATFIRIEAGEFLPVSGFTKKVALELEGPGVYRYLVLTTRPAEVEARALAAYRKRGGGTAVPNPWRHHRTSDARRG